MPNFIVFRKIPKEVSICSLMQLAQSFPVLYGDAAVMIRSKGVNTDWLYE